ncbi:MAG: hypothetical protein ACKVX7_01265 [Planctomycetota bacterium]
MHKLLVFLAVLAMLAIVVYEFRPNMVKDDSTEAARPVASPPAPRIVPSPSPPAALPTVKMPVVEPEVASDATATAESTSKAPLLSIYGALHLARLAVADQLQLTLKTRTAERPIWTDSHGEFTFVVPADDLPFELRGSDGELVYDYSNYRADRVPRYVNLNLLADTVEGLLKPRRVIVERFDGDAYRIVVYGGCGLAIDSLVSTYLLSGDRTVGATSKPWSADHLFGEIVLSDCSLHSGKYAVLVTWKVSSATTEQINAVEASLPKPLPLELQARRLVYIGRPADEKVEVQRITAYVRGVLLEAQAARDMLLGLGWELREKSKPGARNPLDPARKENVGRLELLEKYPPFRFLKGIVSGQSIDLERWRQLIDKDLPARWEPFIDVENIPFPVKYPLLTAQVPLLFQHLNKLSHLESRLIYEELGQQPHRHDFVDGDWDLTTERRETLRRVDDCYQSIREAVGIERTSGAAPK